MAEVTAALDDIFPGLAQAEADGSAEADCSALELCVAAIDAADCTDWPKEIGELYGIPVDEPACRGFIKGKVAPTEACTAQYECDSGFCNDGNGAGGAGPVCNAFIADGQSCADGGLCNPATSYCPANDMCAPRLANGQPCTAAAQCQSRICDTAGTDTCVAPDTTTQCEYVPEGCSFSGGPVRNSLGWSALVIAMVVGAGARRRRRHA